jgi:hypothetical protein
MTRIALTELELQELFAGGVVQRDGVEILLEDIGFVYIQNALNRAVAATVKPYDEWLKDRGG